MKTFIIILSIIGIIAIIFWSVDFIIAFSSWQKRFHIGRFRNRRIWQYKIEKKAKKWIRCSPATPLSDQKRMILWDMLRGKYHSHVLQSWQDAGLLLGLSSEEAKKYYLSHSSTLNAASREIDSILLAYVLSKNNALPSSLESKIKNSFNKYNENNSTIPYRNQIPNIRFVDTIGFVCPFLYHNGFKELAERQINEYDLCLLQDTFPPHAFKLNHKLPLGVYDWSRGLGWYILGITETREMPGNKKRIINLANKLLLFQRKDGGFNCMYFNNNERFESSGTALIGLLFLNAYEITSEVEFLVAAFNTERALIKHTRRDGSVDFAQGDTKGIGFYSNRFDIMPFAQGLSLYLSKKLDKYEKDIDSDME